jgi:ketosteroid isomerase-like protein
VTLSADDRLAILELLARADNAATSRDAETYVALFTDDAVLDGDKGEHRGRQALTDAVGPVWASEGDTSVHVTLNAVIDQPPGDPDRATATSVLVIVNPGPPVVVRNVSTIVQHVVRTGSSWRIARRSVASP